MLKKRRAGNNLDSLPIVQLWLLRLLLPLKLWGRVIKQDDSNTQALAGMFRFQDCRVKGDYGYAETQVINRLKVVHDQAERNWHNEKPPVCLCQNIQKLATCFGLSETDCRILEFTVMLNQDEILREVADELRGVTTIKTFQVLSVLLDLPEADIRASLNPLSALTRSGLLSLDRTGSSSFSGKLDLLSDIFADQVFSFDSDPLSLFSDRVRLSEPARLDLDDYKHLLPSLSILRPYLKKTMINNQRGVNVLLYGKPGTGKTELARVLATECDIKLYEISAEDDDGDPIDGQKRLRAHRAAQFLFSQNQALILFDEAEDVFSDGMNLFHAKSSAQKCKAWVNRIMEGNTTPTFWLANSISHIDPAVIRRFDVVIEMPIPPKAQRKKIIDEACADLLDSDVRNRISDSECLAPALVTRAASVIRCIAEELGPTNLASSFELLINSTLEAQGHVAIRQYDPNRLPEVYDSAFINADADLAEIASGLIQSRTGRLCLYGPPGTGKTAFGRWLAEQMGIPVVAKRASDLLSMWVGQCEKNIARAFRDAERDGALLMIDELDSFLQDRRKAQHSWEITQVNEMLTQMESFSGVFIASTNLVEGLDQATLRRFDLKMKFGFLEVDQAADLLNQYCHFLDIHLPEAQHMVQLRMLDNLTPGDFAAVIRQHRFRPIRTPDKLVEALVAECSLKERSNVNIGFVH